MTYTIVIDTAADLLAACVQDDDEGAILRELSDHPLTATRCADRRNQ